MLSDLSPPTDNLYKFIAITGVVLVALGIYLQVEVARDLRARAWAFNREVAEANVEKSQIESQQKKTPATDTAIGFATTAPGLLDDRTAALVKKTAGMEVTKKELSQAIQEGNGLIIGLWALMAVGASLAAMGFIYWHKKVQVYEDAILKAKAMPESKNTSTSASTDIVRD